MEHSDKKKMFAYYICLQPHLILTHWRGTISDSSAIMFYVHTTMSLVCTTHVIVAKKREV